MWRPTMALLATIAPTMATAATTGRPCVAISRGAMCAAPEAWLRCSGIKGFLLHAESSEARNVKEEERQRYGETERDAFDNF